jgi:hypothetical protein
MSQSAQFICTGCHTRIFSYHPTVPGDQPMCQLCREFGPEKHRLLTAWQEGFITDQEFTEQWNAQVKDKKLTKGPQSGLA